MFSGGLYECTVNDPRGNCRQYQIIYILEIPYQENVEIFDAISVWIDLAETHQIGFDINQIPTRNKILYWLCTWKITIKLWCILGKRLQYSLKHIEAIAINKSQGATLPLVISIEITKEYLPW